jgi:hypothetical protein
MAQQLFGVLSLQLAALIGMLMAIWLLFLAGRIFLPFGSEGNPALLWNQGVRKLFAFAVILGFLQSSQFFWDYLFMPIFSLGIGLSVQLLSQSSNLSCSVGPMGTGVAGAKAVLSSMGCPLTAIQDVYVRGLLTGVAMIFGVSWHHWMDFVKIWTWPGQFLQMLSGVVLCLVYAFGFVMFPLFFVDATLRAAILAILSPLAAALHLFSPTRPLTEQALWGLVQAALTMVFASVAAGLATQSVLFVYSSMTTSDGSRMTDWATLIGSLEAGDLKLSIFDQSYWSILAVGIVSIFMIRGAARMAAVLTGGSSGQFSGATAGLAVLTAVGIRGTAKLGQRANQSLSEAVNGSLKKEKHLVPKGSRPLELDDI